MKLTQEEIEICIEEGKKKTCHHIVSMFRVPDNMEILAITNHYTNKEIEGALDFKIWRLATMREQRIDAIFRN